MGLGNLRRDMKAKAQPALTTSHLATEEWLKQALHGRLGNRVSSFRDPKSEFALPGDGSEFDWPISFAMGQRVTEKTGGQLTIRTWS